MDSFNIKSSPQLITLRFLNLVQLLFPDIICNSTI